MRILPFAVAPSPLGRVDGAQRVDGLDGRRRDRGHGHRGCGGLAAQLSVGRGGRLQLMVLHVVLVVFDQRLVVQVCGWGGAAWPRPRDVLRLGGRLKQPAVSAPRARCRSPAGARLPRPSSHPCTARGCSRRRGATRSGRDGGGGGDDGVVSSRAVLYDGFMRND